MQDLKDKTALVTGGGSGIGLGIATALADEGCRVAICGRDEQKLLDAARGRPASAILTRPCDVTDRDAVAALLAWTEEELGRLDILVNSAGINVARRSMAELDPTDWDRMMAVNATGLFNVLHAALPGMRKKERKKGDVAQLEMTPMIDVVFQLLIFFIVTLKQEDILSHLDVSRPAPDPNQKQEEEVQDLLTVLVYRDGYMLRGRRVSQKELDRQFTRIASFSKTISVIIKCTADSPHKHLIGVLDICAKAGLTNLSVFSM